MRRSVILLVGVVLLAAACGTETDAHESSGSKRVAATNPTVPATVATTTTTLAPPPPAPACTEGYSPCLEPASDYDCEGGSGDGPAYTGAVTVTGADIYALDADGDGSACEPYYEPDPYLDDGYEPYEGDPCEYMDCGDDYYEPQYDPGYDYGYDY